MKQICGILLVIALVFLLLLGSFKLNGDMGLLSFMQSIGMELLGAIMFYYVFERVLTAREKAKEKADAEEKARQAKKEAEEAEKQKLVLDLSQSISGNTQ
jgi:hypothetical protein